MNSKSRRAIEQAALQEGALRVVWNEGKSHHIARFYMPDDLVISMPVSKGNGIDEYKYKGWTRQYIRNPSKWHVRVPPA